MKKNNFILVLIILIGVHKTIYIDGGVVRDTRLKWYEEEIKSKDITSFEYHDFWSHLTCKLDNDKLKDTSKRWNIFVKQKILNYYTNYKNNQKNIKRTC